MSGIENAKAMIFAAGFGTRLKPHTDFHPKALLKINGKSLLERNIEYLKSFGIKEFVINTHHFSGQIHLFLSRYRNSDIKVNVSFEENGPFETGGGLAYAANYLQNSDQPFVVMNADILTNLNLSKMYNFHLTHQPLATLAVTERESSRQFLFDEQMKLSGWRNNKTDELKLVDSSLSIGTLKPFAFSGIHVIHPRIFNLMPASGTFSITNTYLTLASTESIMGFNHSGDVVLDVGKPEAIVEAERIFK
jgi:N-acetyl-alpha-D-muramate 1-phosphate uridylyltransferase